MWNEFVHTLLEITLTMSAVIVLAGVVGLLTRKRYAPKWRCLVWGIIAVRLLVPVNLSLPEAPVSLSREPLAKTVQVRRYNLPERDPLIPEKVDKPAVQEAPASEVVASTSEVTLPERDFPWLSKRPWTAERIAFVIWSVGVAGMTAHYAASYLCFRRRRRRVEGVPSEKTMEELNRIRKQLNLKWHIRLRICGDLPSPMATGLIRPIILLPTEDYTGEELSAIFRHELLHIRRGDLWKKLLFLAAKILHWFNPFVWWMERTANRDIELACDAAVVAGAGTEERSAYGEAILAAMRKGLHRETRTPALVSAFAGGKRTLKERFHVIFDDGKKRSGALALVLILLTVTLGGSLVACGGVEQTNRELTVFCYDNSTYQLLQTTKGRFKNLHPDVDIQFYDIPTYQRLATGQRYEEKEKEREEGEQKSEEELPEIYEQVRNDMLMGKGPDLIFFSQEDKGSGVLFDDVEKVMAAGVFADLTPFIEADESFQQAGYNPGILEAGQYKGRQYAMPLYYSLPVLRANKSVLEKENFDPIRIDSTLDFLNEAIRYKESRGKRRIFAEENQVQNLPRYAGLSLYDFEKRSIDLESTALRKITEQIKTLYADDSAEREYQRFAPSRAYENYERKMIEQDRQRMLNYWICEDHPMNEDWMADSLFAQYDDFSTAYAYFQEDQMYGFDSTLFPLRGMDGKIAAQAVVGAAVSNTSPNQQNAYEFLRLVMTSYDFFDDNVFPNLTPIADQLLYNRMQKQAEKVEKEHPTTIGHLVPMVNEIKGWFGDIGHATFRSGFYDRLEAYFEPYYNDEATYDECLAKAKRELLLYVSE